MHARRPILLATAVIGCLLLAPSAAGAASVHVADGTLRFVDEAGATNAVTLRTVGTAGTVEVRDTAGAPVPGAGCTSNADGSATCTGVARVDVALGAGDDRIARAEAQYPSSVSGGPGNDTIGTIDTQASLDGGEGTDRIVVHGTRGGILSGTKLTDTRVSFSGYLRPYPSGPDAIAGFEQATYAGTAANNSFSAHDFSGPTVIILGGGDDFATGGAGHDVIRGGEGKDVIYGQGGNDVVDGGLGNDEVRQVGRHTIATPTTLRGQGTDRLLSIERLYLMSRPNTASVIDATLWRGPTNLVGDTANDVIRGGSGPDRITPNGGLDRIYGNGGADVIGSSMHRPAARVGAIFDGGPGADRIFTSGVERVFGGAGNDLLDLLNQRKDRSVSCGGGIDTLRLDYADRELPGPDCEREG